jgi:diguanylate cyclase (GGDEF)-like protein
MNAQGLWAQFGVLAMLIGVLATWVALDVARRAQLVPARMVLRWLLGAAVALATGLWSAHLMLVSVLVSDHPVGYQVGGIIGSWGVAFGFSLAGLACAAGRWERRSRPGLRLLGGAFLLALGTVGTSVCALQALDHPWVLPGNAGMLLLAFGAALAGCTATVGLFFWPRAELRPVPVSTHALAAVAMGLFTLISQLLTASALDAPVLILEAGTGGVTSSAMAILASVGSMALLLTMMLGSMLEAQLHASLRQARGQLQKHAYTDALTDLPNRLLFEEALADAVREADECQGRFALLLIDLDGFKAVNASFGHRTGDRLLRETAVRLRVLAGRSDTVARLGGDEFLMLLGGGVDDHDVASHAAEVLEALSQPCKTDGRETSLSCTIGIAMYPNDGAMASLLSHADAAKRAAKANGGATYCFFSPHMMSDVRDQVELLRDLRTALAKGQFELYYQPKVHAPSSEITGVEALMRWHHPQRGVVSPMIFVPLAERFGLIGALGSWVIDEACRHARVWRDEGLRMRVAINLSVHQLRQPDLPAHIDAALRLHEINPRLLTCEITESAAMEDSQGTMRLFERLAAVGVNISIDDFGTGYSSLAYLRKLPASELKIDRSFVLDLETSSDARAVVDAVIKLAQALGLKVVAEGVETEAQHHILRSLGCDELQGYLFAKPMSAQVLSAWARRNVGPKAMAFRPSLFGDTLSLEL